MVSEACSETLLEFSDDDVDLEDFTMPTDYNLEDAVHAITEGSGYYMLRGMFNERDVEIARDRVGEKTRPSKVST